MKFASFKFCVSRYFTEVKHHIQLPNVKVFIRTISSCAITTRMYLHDVSLKKKKKKKKKKIEWIIHSIYGVKRFHSLRSEFHSILTPVEWKFTTQRVKSRPVHSRFTPKEVITDITTQRVRVGLELGLRWGFGCGSCTAKTGVLNLTPVGVNRGPHSQVLKLHPRVST